MHLLKVSFISWRWQKRLFAPLPNPHPPAFHGCQIMSGVPCPAVIQNWIVLQGFGEWRLLYPDWVWNHGQACLTLLCLHFNISKCTRACWLNVFFYVYEKEIIWKELWSDTYMQTYFHWKKISLGAVGGGYSLFQSLHWDTVGKEIIKDVCGWMEFKCVWHCVVSMSFWRAFTWTVDRGLHEYGLDMNLMPSIPFKSSLSSLNEYNTCNVDSDK